MSERWVRHSIFINVPHNVLYRYKKGYSCANLSHLQVVRATVKRLFNTGATKKQVAVLTPYRAQLRLLKMLLPAGLTLSTMDAAEAKEYKFVILDLVTPGGKRYPLRSAADMHKMCVGLSRAQIGLLIVGSENMYL